MDPLTLPLLLAQGADPLEQADKAVDVSTKLAEAGPVALAIFVMLVAIGFAIWMLRKNWALRATYEKEVGGLQKDIVQLQRDQAVELRTRETTAKQEADARLKDVLDEAKERREAEKGLMREMVEYGRDSNEAVGESAKAIENSNRIQEALTREVSEMRRELQEMRRER